MVKLVKYGASETKTVTDFKREIANLDFSSFSGECYSSFEYRLKWKAVMYHKHYSRRLKTSKVRPPASPPEEVIQRRTRGRGRGPRAGGGAADVGEDGVRDVLDMIDAADAAQQAVAMADTGLDMSDEDCGPDGGRRAPGPPRKPWATAHPCAACLKLYKKAKRAKQTPKDKLLDNDPKSLTCDQWVLLKRWTPRRGVTRKARRLRQLKFDKQAEVTEEEEEEEEVWSCCRPHPFLHRNLRRVQMSSKRGKGKENKMKRPRADSSGPRAAKQQRFQAEDDRQSFSISSVEDSSSSCQETENQADASVGAELIPSCMSLKTPEPRRTLFEPRQKRGFRELLAQLRGSTIVRETQ